MKTIRKTVFRARLEAQLSKYERRIQKMAEAAYDIRQILKTMKRGEVQDALYKDGSETSVGEEAADAGAGGSNVLDPATSETVLGERPAQLPDDSRDLGVNSGSTI